MSAPLWSPDNSFARELPELGVRWTPRRFPAPRLVFLNRALADELGLGLTGLTGHDLAELWCGARALPGAQPVAQVYAGHQFGGFSPQLGDGRALLLGETVDRQGRRRDLAFKGSGATPFARNGDGLAAVGPMLREVLIGEAMHALGVATTRALAVVATGEAVQRERTLPGAVLTRVAASHLRVGSFEYVAARGELALLRRLLAYALQRHDPELAARSAPGAAPLALLEAVARRQAALVAQWMNVGFIHGVMNTDNMTISGETIDYGPCAFVEAYDPATVFSSIDHGGRYAFGNQPRIARWNLARLAEALLPLLAAPDDEAGVQAAVAAAVAVVDAFPSWFEQAWRRGQRAKLGLAGDPGWPAARRDAADAAVLAAVGAAQLDQLADDWLALLHAQAVDFTLAWRRLADAVDSPQGAEPGRDAQRDGGERGDAGLRALFTDPAALDAWLARWRDACARADRSAGLGAAPAAARAGWMRCVNPFVIPRNHRVEQALEAASEGADLAPFEALLAALRRPFDESAELAPYGEPAPADETAAYRTFCGT